jgi:hypothetical protein
LVLSLVVHICLDSNIYMNLGNARITYIT